MLPIKIVEISQCWQPWKYHALISGVYIPASQWYPYFDVVMGLGWSNDPESYASVSGAIGRASHAREVKGNDPDKRRYHDPPDWR